ncbi:hypothetical protein [Streptomyces sp. SA15]|uniref:hypothetical protein n=1 Tax=Streptomyces sp. SA15 TaxID=934019 RepID=UPI00211B9946|nr:hypothetical protein [Streptomyces sp. SA15]
MSDETWGEEDEHAIAERIDKAHADNPRLTAWLAEQQGRFEEWERRHGGGWDFSERSLDRLEARIREHFTSVDDLLAGEHTPLAQVACWYLGEVHNRLRGTQWRMDPDPADTHPWSERPYVIVPFDRINNYRDEEGIDYDARPQHAPLSSFMNLLRSPVDRAGMLAGAPSLRAELDDYEPNA